MNRVLKTFLLWLLVVALPTQGIAVAANVSCGPVHHQSVAVSATFDAVHHEAMDAGHDHHHGQNAAAIVDVSSESSSDNSTHAVSNKCSACAACCIGSVAPPSSASLNSEHNDFTFTAISSAPMLSGHIPAGLERPPRSLLV
jgi:hypothetical protein